MFRCDVWGVVRGPDLWGPDPPDRFREPKPLQMGRCRRLVVVTPHLDEDVCAAGGLLATVAERCVPVDVLALTEGDGATEDRGDAAAELGHRRAHRCVAYERLGVHTVQRHELLLASGTVRESEPLVAAALDEIVGNAGEPDGLWVLAPWQHDGHPDHDAAGRAAAAVCDTHRLRLFQFLVAAWRGPQRAEVPWELARSVPLSPLLGVRKNYAVPTVVHRDGPPGARELLLATAQPGGTHGRARAVRALTAHRHCRCGRPPSSR